MSIHRRLDILGVAPEKMSRFVTVSNCCYQSGAKGTRTPDPHTASVKLDVLCCITTSTTSRSVQLNWGCAYSCVQCVFARDRAS
jgi:hypothetical protein